MRRAPCLVRHTLSRSVPLAAAALVAAVLAPATAATAQSGAAPDTARTTLVLVNPFSFLVPGASAEVEHAISRSASVALSGSYYPRSNLGYSTVTAKLRLYPQEHAPSGFAVGVGVGMAGQEGYYCPASCGSTTEVKPTIGVALDYTWLFGATRHFGLSLGAGLQRVLGVSTTYSGASTFLPMGRLGVGYAF